MPVSNSLYFVTLFTPLKICDSNPTVIISKCLLFFQTQPLYRPDYFYMWLISCCCHNCPINNFNFIYFLLCWSKVSGNLNQNLNARMDNFFPVLYQMNRTTGVNTLDMFLSLSTLHCSTCLSGLHVCSRMHSLDLQLSSHQT